MTEAWRGSPWFFIGWQLALCAIAVLVALLRGAEGRVRSGVIHALGIAGGALVVRRAGSLIGWLMLAEGAGLAFITLASTYCLLGVTTFPGDLPAARQVGTLAESGFASVAFILVLMFLLFPTGKLPSRRWRLVVAAGIAAAALNTIGLILRPRLVQIPVPGGSRRPSPTRSARRGFRPC